MRENQIERLVEEKNLNIRRKIQLPSHPYGYLKGKTSMNRWRFETPHTTPQIPSRKTTPDTTIDTTPE